MSPFFGFYWLIKGIIVLPPIFISLLLSFAQSFRRTNIMGYRKKEILLFYIKVGCMCDEK